MSYSVRLNTVFYPEAQNATLTELTEKGKEKQMKTATSDAVLRVDSLISDEVEAIFGIDNNDIRSPFDYEEGGLSTYRWVGCEWTEDDPEIAALMDFVREVSAEYERDASEYAIAFVRVAENGEVEQYGDPSGLGVSPNFTVLDEGHIAPNVVELAIDSLSRQLVAQLLKEGVSANSTVNNVEQSIQHYLPEIIESIEEALLDRVSSRLVEQGHVGNKESVPASPSSK